MYEVGLSRGFRAWHVMPDVEGPESKLHTHDYRLEIVVTRAALDARAMVVDLDVLQEALDEVVATVADKDLDGIKPPDAQAVTVEVLARWAHGAMARAVAGAGGERLSVRAWESPEAFGGYAADVSSP